MKKNYFLIVVVMLTAGSIKHVDAQHWVVNQVIVGTGGDWSNPDDFVSVASFKPNDEITTTFGSILTQSVQDIVINGSYAFVAAQDSIVKYNIDTYEKIVSIEAIGVNRLLINEDILFVSFQYPATENFVKVFSAEDLSLITNIAEVSDESAGMLVVNQLAYVAVPGGWSSTVGKIAIIELSDYSLVDEINFEAQGIGVYDLFYYDDKIMSVNRTPWGGTHGYLTAMNALGSHTDIYLIQEKLGKMVGLKDDILYAVMDGGIGSIDLTDYSVIDTAVVAESTLTIADAEMDTLNGLFYVTSTDYFSMGVGIIYNMDGGETGSFDCGISPDATAIDYRDNTGVSNLFSDIEVNIYPNPASEIITIEVTENVSSENYKIIDISGRVIVNSSVSLRNGTANIDISKLERGLYFLMLSDGNSSITSSFVKK